MLETERLSLSKEIEDLAEKYHYERQGLLPILLALKANHHHIGEFAMQEIAGLLSIHPVEVFGVVSFYTFLSTKPQGQFVIRLCKTISCDLAGKDRVARQLENELNITFGETTKDNRFSLHWANCLGMCDQGPALLINDFIFTHVTPEVVYDIIECCRRTFGVFSMEGKNAIECLSPVNSCVERESEKRSIFYTPERNKALKATLTQNRVNVIQQIREADLKGRGGAGFPTHIKWNLAATASDPVKYVICNADEGEPGTFKDRLLLSDYTESVIEGMTIAGYAIGSNHGIIYLRGEYSYLKSKIQEIIDKRREEGLLGNNINGHDEFSFDIEIFLGSGAYICGEETALIESMEGQRGEPRNRPPFPVNTGYNSHPTVVNNVETFVVVANIMVKGAKWFKSIGTEKSNGTKLLSVSGDCKNPGIYEISLGITIKDLLIKVGGDEAKAVQVGGASGRCVPKSEFDHTIAFEDISTNGSIIVFGPETDMIKVMENFLEFFVDESCGQCTPCRIGNVKLLEGVSMLKSGTCSIKYLRELQSLGETMQCASKCGLGQSSANSFLSITNYFKDEILGRNQYTIP